MKIISNIIRGGQLSLHAIRMFKQVLNLLLVLTGSFGIMLFIVSLYQNTRVEEWAGYRDYQIANILKTMHLPNQKVTVYYGREASTVRASTVVDSWYFQDFKEKIERKMEEAGKFALKSAGIVLVIVSSFFIYRGFRRTGEQFRRGAKLSGFEKVRSKIEKENRKHKYEAYKIARMPYPHLGEMQHTLVIGANGTGKTVLISDIVEQIRKRGDKAIIYDKKGDYTKWFYNPDKDKILNPFDERSELWNLLSEIDNVATVKQIGKAFIPDQENQSGEGKIWDEAGRIAFTEIVNKLHANGEDISNREIVDKMLRQDMKKIAKILKRTYGQATIDPNSPRTAASVLFVLAAHFNSLKLNNSKPQESFSIREWVLEEERESILFMTSQENLISELSPLQTAWFEIAIGGILSKKQDMENNKRNNDNNNNSKTWVIMDELPALSRIPSLGNALATTRSYGGCFVLGMQNIAQLREVYGKNGAQNISSECNTRCIFQSNDADTAKWMSDNIGQVEITEFKEGLSYGANTIRDGVNISQQDRVKSVLLPSEILNMKRLNLILKVPDYGAVKARLKYKKREVIERAFVKSSVIIEDLKSVYEDVQEIIDEGGDKSSDNVDIEDMEGYRVEERNRDDNTNNKGVNAEKVINDKIINDQNVI